MPSHTSVARVGVAIILGLALGVVVHQATKVPGLRLEGNTTASASVATVRSIDGTLDNLDCSNPANFNECCSSLSTDQADRDTWVTHCCDLAFNNDITPPSYCFSSSSTSATSSISSSGSSSSSPQFCCTPTYQCIPLATGSSSSAACTPFGGACTTGADCCSGNCPNGTCMSS
jgi:hypothetical protein